MYQRDSMVKITKINKNKQRGKYENKRLQRA